MVCKPPVDVGIALEEAMCRRVGLVFLQHMFRTSCYKVDYTTCDLNLEAMCRISYVARYTNSTFRCLRLDFAFDA